MLELSEAIAYFESKGFPNGKAKSLGGAVTVLTQNLYSDYRTASKEEWAKSIATELVKKQNADPRKSLSVNMIQNQIYALREYNLADLSYEDVEKVLGFKLKRHINNPRGKSRQKNVDEKLMDNLGFNVENVLAEIEIRTAAKRRGFDPQETEKVIERLFVNV